MTDAKRGTRNDGSRIRGIPASAVDADADRVALIALAEDGAVDVTTLVTASANESATGRIEYRTGGVVAGTAWADAVARLCECSIEWAARDGDPVPVDAVIGWLRGSFPAVLRAERPLLNVLQQNVGQYESAFGEIRLEPHAGSGFVQ